MNPSQNRNILLNTIWIYVLLFIGSLIVPVFMDKYWQSVAVLAGIYIILGLSLNVIVGYAGMFQLGHAAFYGIGAYTAAILNINFDIPILLLIPASAAVSGLFAFVLTRPILHLRGDYLCIVTIAFGEIVRIVLKNDIFGITGGPNGISGIARPEIFGFKFKDPIHYYYLVWVFVVLSIFVIRRLENSRLGRAWNYVREDELAAEAMGIDTVKVKLAAFVIGSAWAGIAGLLYASRYRVIAPENFSFLESVIMFCIVVLGGTGSISGVFVGTFGMIVLPEIFRPLKDWRDAWLGVAMVIMMILRPAGLWPSRRLRLELEGAADDGKPGDRESVSA